jgi:hypothetical protein
LCEISLKTLVPLMISSPNRKESIMHPSKKTGDSSKTPEIEGIKTNDEHIEEQIRAILFKAAGGVSDMAEVELQEIMFLLHQECERAVLEAIGEDEPNLAADYTDTFNMGLPLQAIQFRNQFRAEIRAKLTGTPANEL